MSLSDIFRELAQSTGLLGESIFEIQWSWDGLDHLKHGNYILRSLSKGLKFLRMVSTKESPKIMGLKGIHDPDALQHFASYTYCPWCSKDRQKEGTVINHLRTVHYKLGGSYVTSVLDVLWWHRTPSANMDATAVPIKVVSSTSPPSLRRCWLPFHLTNPASWWIASNRHYWS